jgi:hypothetical protein
MYQSTHPEKSIKKDWCAYIKKQFEVSLSLKKHVYKKYGAKSFKFFQSE